MLGRSLGEIGLPSAYLAYAVEVGRGGKLEPFEADASLSWPFPRRQPHIVFHLPPQYNI
jgi:hypothetical protein